LARAAVRKVFSKKEKGGCVNTDDNEKSMSDLFKLNVSTIFLLYPLGIKYQGLKGLGFLNAYLEDSEFSWEGDVVLLLFKPKNVFRFQFWVEQEKERTPAFIDEYDYEEGFTVLVYQFPIELKEDLELIKQGKYSRVSKAYIATVPESSNVVVKDSEGKDRYAFCAARLIVHKDPEWIKIVEEMLGLAIHPSQEFWLKMKKEKETLNISRIREELKQNKLLCT
jgi:hypothetical protein